MFHVLVLMFILSLIVKNVTACNIIKNNIKNYIIQTVAYWTHQVNNELLTESI